MAAFFISGLACLLSGRRTSDDEAEFNGEQAEAIAIPSAYGLVNLKPKQIRPFGTYEADPLDRK